MTRRNPSQYNWDALEFDETILPADPPRYNSPRQAGIEFVVLHHMTVLGRGDGGALDTCVNIWKERVASAGYGVDGGQVRQFVWDNDAAWATADWDGNHRGISIEHANSAVGDASGWPVAETTWRTGARLTAYLHRAYKLGRPWTRGGVEGTVRVHQCFFATGCPGPFMMANLNNYVAEAARVYDAITGGRVQAAVGPASNTTVTPIQEDDMGIYDDLTRYDQFGKPDGKKTSVATEAQWASANFARLSGQVSGLLEAVKQLAKAQGKDLDIEAVKQAAKEGASEAIAGGVNVGVTVNGRAV